jgi:hypothetical protein
MPRIAKADVLAKLQRIADLKKAADGNSGTRRNNVTSRAEDAKQLEGLKGYERGVYAMFSAFADHRDSLGMRFKDIDRAVAYAADKMINRLDKNNNGLDNKEIAAGSKTVQMIVEWIKLDRRNAQTPPAAPDQSATSQNPVGQSEQQQ